MSKCSKCAFIAGSIWYAGIKVLSGIVEGVGIDGREMVFVDAEGVVYCGFLHISLIITVYIKYY